MAILGKDEEETTSNNTNTETNNTTDTHKKTSTTIMAIPGKKKEEEEEEEEKEKTTTNKKKPDTDTHTHLIFIYGTLKRGFGNHHVIDDQIQSHRASYIAPFTTLQSFPLVIGPYGIPYLINLPGIGSTIKGELYSVSSGPGLARLDELEGVGRGYYERLPVDVVDEGGNKVMKVEAYFADKGYGEALWKRCGEVGLGEYSAEMGKKYVPLGDRPPHSDIVQDIWNFISQATYIPSVSG